MGMEGDAGGKQRRQVQRLRVAVTRQRAEPRGAGLRVPDARRRSPRGRQIADASRGCTLRSRRAERREAAASGRRMEFLAHRDARQSRRTLAEWCKGPGVRARHSAHGFAPCREQVQSLSVVRATAARRRPHHPAGPRRRSLFPEHQGEALMKRREFVQTTAAAGLGMLGWRRWEWPSDNITVAVMGLNGRGTVLARAFARKPNVTVSYLCAVESTALAKAATSNPRRTDS